MGTYDYVAGKKRINEILRDKIEIIESDRIPNDENFTFSNAYKGWVTAIFIDIRKSSVLFAEEDKEKMAKVIRSFTSEVIEIVRNSENLREIGIRGDCVYSIYATPTQNDIHEIYTYAYIINSFMKMLNKLTCAKSLPQIEVGIGIGTSKELVVKAGRKDTGINNKVWIGEAVTKASNLSSLGNKGKYSPIVMSSLTYSNIIDIIIKGSGEKAREWFTKTSTNEYGIIYDCSIIDTTFVEWINNGMGG